MDRKGINRRRPRDTIQPMLFEMGMVPPQCIDLEEAVLGALLLEQSPESAKVILKLKAEVFYKESHQKVAESIIRLKDKGIPIELLTVTEDLRESGNLDMIGGAYFVTNLIMRVSQAKNVEFHYAIVYQKYLSRKIIQICQTLTRSAYEDRGDVFDLLETCIDELDSCNPDNVFALTTKASEVANAFMEDLDKDHEHHGIIATYETGHPRFDDVITMARDKLILLSGPAKGGKSKIIADMMFRLLERYTDIAVYWVTLEDSQKDILRTYLSQKVHVKPKWIRERRFPKSYIEKMKEWTMQFKGFDINFRDQSIHSKDIVYQFSNFCEQRPEKFCILIVDNIMSLADREDYQHDLNGMYDYVMHNMLLCRQKTHALIWTLHHYNDAQQEKDNIETGYRPTMKDIKGTEAFRRIPNQVLLLNNFKIYKDLINKYQGNQREILKHLVVIDTGANREDNSDEEHSLIHYFCNLDYCLFKEVEIVKEAEEPEKPAKEVIDVVKASMGLPNPYDKIVPF